MALSKKCCFCIDIETGGKIFGWLSVIGSIISMIISIKGLIFYSLKECRGLRVKFIWKTYLKNIFIGQFCYLSGHQFGYLLIAISLCCAIAAVCSWMLLQGINERDACKVCFYRWFLIFIEVILIIYTIFSHFDGMLEENTEESTLKIKHSSVINENVYKIIVTLWFYYEIFVIDSLEKMYREQTLPVVQQPGVIWIQLCKNRRNFRKWGAKC